MLMDSNARVHRMLAAKHTNMEDVIVIASFTMVTGGQKIM